MAPKDSTRIEEVRIPQLAEHLPMVLDDFTLAALLQIPRRTLWYAVTHPHEQYHMFLIRTGNVKRNGTGGKIRKIHAPEPVMRKIARQLLSTLLNPQQALLGDHVTAYRPGRSIPDAIKQHIPHCPVCSAHYPLPAPTHADCPHDGVSIHLDLKNFFHHTRRSWIRQYFKGLGYTHQVASYLAALCTCPIHVKLPAGQECAVDADDDPEYPGCGSTIAAPQGSPTSGAICNLVAAERLDPLILAYIEERNKHPRFAGEYRWVYTRYSDDLAFTCGRKLSRREIKDFLWHINKCIQTARYTVNHKKTRWTHPGWRKHLLGSNMHQCPNPNPKLYRKVRGILHNCLCSDLKTQTELAAHLDIENLPTWLLGQINWITQLNPAKGAKLRAVYNQVIHKEAACP